MMAPKIGLDQVARFSPFPLKALLSGHGYEIIDQAKITIHSARF